MVKYYGPHILKNQWLTRKNQFGAIHEVLVTAIDSFGNNALERGITQYIHQIDVTDRWWIPEGYPQTLDQSTGMYTSVFENNHPDWWSPHDLRLVERMMSLLGIRCRAVYRQVINGGTTYQWVNFHMECSDFVWSKAKDEYATLMQEQFELGL